MSESNLPPAASDLFNLLLRSFERGFAAILRTVVLTGTGFVATAGLCAPGPLANTQPLTMEGDLSAQMVAGIGRFLDRELAESIESRGPFWQPDFSGPAAYEKSVQTNRERLVRMIGAVDTRLPNPGLEYVSTVAMPAKVAETDRFTAFAVRWPVFEGVFGEGLLLQPKGRVIARVIAVPDADQMPEVIAGVASGLPVSLQFARRLAENGCQVIVPALLDRTDRFSGSPLVSRRVNQPHREWIYRQAYTLGRHVIGYEVQTMLSAVDWLTQQNQARPLPIGAAGWGEGGLVAMYGAAIDTRIDSALVSGYFGPRERVWQEPIYRNVFGLLEEFGDAEITRLIVPRSLLVEHAAAPAIEGPPPVRDGRSGAAPGRIETPRVDDVRAEIERARLLAGPFSSSIRLYRSDEDMVSGPVSAGTLLSFLRSLDPDVTMLAPSGQNPVALREGVDLSGRQERLVRQMERHTQRLLQLARGVRDEFLWTKVSPTTPEEWAEAMRPYRAKLWDDLIGRFPTGRIPPRPRSRLIHDQPTWTAHEVVLDVLPDVFAWGYFLVPKGMNPGERRPVVVAQHGLEGLPASLLIDDPDDRAHRVYKAFAVRLVERGFIVFAPHNPYRGGDLFRVLQRKANPLGKSLFSVIIAQHESILDWLSAQPIVDANRIGFYGLSYGGVSAVRIPAVLERYAVSVCSGAFNEWMMKTTSTDLPYGYMFYGEYEMPDFNHGMTFGHAEMAALIAPRPFMVERGHRDGVARDEWVAFEYARVNRLYSKLKIYDRSMIEYFDGPHTIHGVGSYAFLHRHLSWPEPPVRPPAR